MNECIFCQIVRREVPAEILYENENAIGVLDINPIHYGHSLIIPKDHCRNFLELPQRSFSGVLQAAQIVTRALVDALRLEAFNLFSNNGQIAGQSVFHFHLHITPRYKDDNIRFVLKLKKYRDGEISRFGEQIRRSISTHA